MNSNVWGAATPPPRPRQQHQPQLVIPQAQWEQMMGYVQLCDDEINGFGLVEVVGSRIIVTDIFITEQTVGPGSADVAEADIHKLMFELTKAGIDTGRLRLQWHSHVHMPAYFSGVDTANIERYSGEWMTSLVMNKYGENSARLDLYKPFRLVVEDLPVRIQQPRISPATVTQCRAEIAAKVKKRAGMLGRRAYRPAPAALAYGGALDTDELEMWEVPER